MRPRAGAGGFTVLELLIATAIMTVVVGAMFTVMHPSRGAFAAQIEAADVYQRLRAAADALRRDLLRAGAGPSLAAGAGPSWGAGAASSGAAAGPSPGAGPGPLIKAMAPVLPHRIGRRQAEAGVFRSHAIGILSVARSAAQATLRLPDGTPHLARTTRTLWLQPGPHCPTETTICGFAAGTRAMLFDAHGAWDLVTVTAVAGDHADIAYDDSLSAGYAAGAWLAEVSARTYYLQADTRAGTFQLRRYDGFESDLPLVDDVVAFEVAYFGDPEPPRVLGGSGAGDAPRTTYGPPPPLPGDDNPNDTWAAGENCLFSIAGGAHVPRLPPLALPPPRLVPLDPAMLADGPWCPDDTSPRRIDADLLRVRLLRITLRVQVTPAALRGPAGTLFTYGGTAQSETRVVPDLEVQFDVALRNVP